MEGTPSQKTPQEMAASADPAEKLEGVRLWIAQIDRRLGTRFYALGAAAVLALAAGIVAVVMALGLQDDSATKGDLTKLRDQVDQATQSASSAAEDDLSDIQKRLDELETRMDGVESSQSSSDKEVSVAQDDIADIRDRIDRLESDVQDAQDAAASAGSDSNANNSG